MQLSQGTQSLIAGALVDFVGYLTTQSKAVTAGASETVYDLHDAFFTWASKRRFDIEKAQPDHHWDKKQASEATLEDLVNEGNDSPGRIAGALMSFMAYCKVAQTEDFEGAVLKWATKTGLDLSNPQHRWHAQWWG
jgi:hypothetical protein